MTFTGIIDAKTFGADPEDSLDFIISAHVIEHLENPIGSFAIIGSTFVVNENIFVLQKAVLRKA